MAKKKSFFIEEEERFVIPQINHTLTGLITKKEGFKKSKVVSPYHGTNVLDNKSYVDNSGSVNVDYNYDYLRENKKISDEELIKRHGTKYYEFNFLNKEEHNDYYGGSNYNKNKKKTVITEEKEKKTFGFIHGIEDIETEPVVVEKKVETKFDENRQFKLNLSIDEEDTYEVSSFKNTGRKTTIPSFLTNKNTTSFEEEIIIDKPKDDYSNPAVNKNQSIQDAIKNMTPFTQQDIVKPEIKTPVLPKQEEIELELPVGPDYSNYYIPYEEFLNMNLAVSDDNPAWLQEKKEIINDSLSSFGIEGEVVTYTKGPAFTRYEIMLGQGVNVKKINQIYENLQKDLQATSIRVLAPIPGKNTVGIEVPNNVAEIVPFSSIISEKYMNDGKPLSVAMGKNIDGTPVYQNIPDMPHALIAGATQSGKSVSINTILISLLLKNSPDNLRLILIDPKKVELSFYNDLPHLITPVIDDPQIATESLKWAVEEMERRYDVLSKNRCRNIKDYNTKRSSNPKMEKMSYIVIVVDEFNDLIMQCGQEANDAIVRLAQKARACGIHIILATQRPTVDVVSGTIKANITCRIAFRVASDVDSRTILDEIGAENLLGRGDMLIKNNGIPIRAQGAYISDDEITAICDYITSQYNADFLFTHADLRKKLNNQNQGGLSSKDSPGEDKQLLYQIALYCVQQNACSINSIQNNFSLGFNRAQRIVNILENMEIVSPKNSTKGREILVDSYRLREIFEMD
jgi:S-DNA-T family DNA segregation ATPase FtsK/SpoIIIE